MSSSLSKFSASDDFDRIVAVLNRHHVDFMIIGGWAVAYHGHVRLTEDLDIYIPTTCGDSCEASAGVARSPSNGLASATKWRLSIGSSALGRI